MSLCTFNHALVGSSLCISLYTIDVGPRLLNVPEFEQCYPLHFSRKPRCVKSQVPKLAQKAGGTPETFVVSLIAVAFIVLEDHLSFSPHIPRKKSNILLFGADRHILVIVGQIDAPARSNQRRQEHRKVISTSPLLARGFVLTTLIPSAWVTRT